MINWCISAYILIIYIYIYKATDIIVFIYYIDGASINEFYCIVLLLYVGVEDERYAGAGGRKIERI